MPLAGRAPCRRRQRCIGSRGGEATAQTRREGGQTGRPPSLLVTTKRGRDLTPARLSANAPGARLVERS